MRFLTLSIHLLACIAPVSAQEVDQSHFEILGPITDDAHLEAAPEPVMPEFTVEKSRTTRITVNETGNSPDLPAVQGIVNVTVQRVADPGLADPPQSTPSSEPAAGAGTEELRGNRRDWNPVLLSATVYDHTRSLLRIRLKGNPEGGITAWSNIDFNHFSGFAGYRVKQADGSTRESRLLMMGLGNIDTAKKRDLSARQSRTYDPPEIPDLPDLAAAGPAFAIVEGDITGEARDTLVQLHDLYREEGQRMADAFLARMKDREERKALILANPPQPEDVSIQVWRRENPLNAQEGGSAR